MVPNRHFGFVSDAVGHLPPQPARRRSVQASPCLVVRHDLGRIEECVVDISPAPLFFPSKASKNPPPPFPPRRRSSSRSFSRAPSVNSIYQHPQHYQHQPDGQAVDSHDHTARKRPRSADQNVNEVSPPGPKSTHLDVPASRDDHSRRSSATSVDDEDIFGRRAGSVTPRPRSEHLLLNGIDDPAPGEGSSSKNKRVKVPQQTLDNKAVRSCLCQPAFLATDASRCSRSASRRSCSWRKGVIREIIPHSRMSSV